MDRWQGIKRAYRLADYDAWAPFRRALQRLAGLLESCDTRESICATLDVEAGWSALLRSGATIREGSTRGWFHKMVRKRRATFC